MRRWISHFALCVCVCQFAVHLGVARGSSVVVLEQTGKNSGYRDRDVCGFCPESHRCVEGGPEKLDSVINMRVVSKEFRQAGEDVVYSRDAGRYSRHQFLCSCSDTQEYEVTLSVLLLRYLCEFAYYCSLYHGERRAALVHVPSCGGLSSADRLVPLLQSLIQTMLEQLEGPCVR